MRKPPKSICAKCKHFSIKNTHGREPMWYNYYCQAVENQRMIDPVTGEEKFMVTNDLGGRALIDDRYPNCRTINPTGNCRLFAKK